MPVTVVVGGQYGSEGKGKLVAHLSLVDDVDVVVRCGGPNAGHTVLFNGNEYLLRQVPGGLVNPRTRLLLAAGSVVNPKILLDEIEQYDVRRDHVGVDRNAAVITEKEIEHERQLRLRERIASTLSGTGSATGKKALREKTLRLAKDVAELQEFFVDVPHEVNRAIDQGKKVIIEGTQGFGLSLHHSGHYPYVTSRDTTAAAFISEVGISPRCVDDIVLVVRTYPIRVGGRSGPMRNEISWDDVQRRSGYPVKVCEYTTVTHTLRRVGKFDWDLLDRAVGANRPTMFAVHGVDYLSYDDLGKTRLEDLSPQTLHFLSKLDRRYSVPVRFVYTGPTVENLIDIRKAPAELQVVAAG